MVSSAVDCKIYKRTPSRVDRILNPIENAIYRICGVDPAQRDGLEGVFPRRFIL